MKKIRILILFLLLFNSIICHAGLIEKLDDSTSPQAQVRPIQVLSNNGLLLSEDPNAQQAILKYGDITFRLNTQAYLNKPAKIYLSTPSSIQGLNSPRSLKVEWRRGTLFHDAQAYAGERILVWSGTVKEGWFTDTLEMTFTFDLKNYKTSSAFAGIEPYFEIETL